MSKKSYKHIQNRLYREIKRRIIAENKLLKPVQFTKHEQKVETLKISYVLSDRMKNIKESIEFVKNEMATKIAHKLIADCYVKFNYFGDYYCLADDEEIMDIDEIEAILNVVRPWN